MPGIPYKVPFTATAMTAADDIVNLKAGTAKPCFVRRLVIENSSDTDAERWQVTISRYTGGATQGSGGTAITPKSPLHGQAATAATARVFDTTPTSGGTQEVLEQRAFDILIGMDAVFDPPIELAPTDIFVALLNTTPIDAVTICGLLDYDEMQ